MVIYGKWMRPRLRERMIHDHVIPEYAVPGPDYDPDRAARRAKIKRVLVLGIVGYLVVLVGIGLAVSGMTGSTVAGLLTTVALLFVMPWVATALRANYQKRMGLPVRGY